MDATLIARAKLVSNPFVSNRVDSAWDSDSVDVAAINRTAFQRCGETIELVRNTSRCRGLLLAGEPGSGKTHLLQRLRRHVQHGARDCFVYVPPVSGPDRFFRDLLQHTVQDLVGNRTGSPSSQIESLLVRELLRPETRAKVTPAMLWTDVRRRYPPGDALFCWLEARIQKLCVHLELEPDVARVLQHYLAEYQRFEAYSWLLGRSVSDEVLERLGVRRTLEEDSDALSAIVTLSRLAGKHSVLVLAFDQLEALQVDEHDQQGLKAFAGGVAKLFVECRNVATISCVQNYFVQDLKRAVPPALMDRLAQDQGALTSLQKTSAIELVTQRLGVSEELRAARSAVGEREPLWPLERADIEQSIPKGGVPARTLLNYCRDRFEHWCHGEVPAAATQSLEELWNTQIERTTAEPADEGVLVDGLLKLMDARMPGTCKRCTVRDVDLVVGAPSSEIGIAICHAQNMTSLAARLKRLQTVAESGRFKRLVIVRDARLPLSSSAKATHERLNTLQQAGHLLLRPPAEAYAAIAAARQLLADAAAGDLSLNGKTVAPEDLKAWLAGNLNAATADLLAAFDAPDSPRFNHIVERVQALLEGRWVVSAADIAASMDLEQQALVNGLTTEQHAIGILAGPPAVLFLRPEGLRRE